MGPKTRPRNAARRLAGSSFVLFVVAGVIAVSVARTWAQVEPTCKTPQVIQEINRLKTEVATQRENVDRAEKAWDDASNAYEACERKKGPAGNCFGEQQWAAHLKAEYEKDEIVYYDLRVRLEALERLPNCPVVPQTPPPPPKPDPTPTPTPTPKPKPTPPGVTVTHRETTCPRCQPIAAKLNQAADNYALAVNRHDPDQTMFRQQMSEYSNELDQCERQCVGPPNSPIMQGPGSGGQQQQQRPPDNNRQPFFDWGPFTIPIGPGSMQQQQRPPDYRQPSR